MNQSADERLVVMLEARIRDFEKNMQRAEQRGTRSYTRLRRDSRTATQGMEQDMIRSTSRINQALATTSTKIGAFGGAFLKGAVVGAATMAFAGLNRNVMATVKSIADLGDVSRRVSISLGDLQGLQHGFQLAGIAADELNASLARFGRRVGEAAEGGGPLQSTLERWGLSVRRANGELKSQMEMLREIAEIIRKAPSDQQKLAIAQAAFGDSGRRMVNAFKDGAEGIDGMIEAARRAGVVLDDDLIRKAEEIDAKFARLSLRVDAFYKRLVIGAFEAAEEWARLREENDALMRIFEGSHPLFRATGAAIGAAFGEGAEAATGMQARAEEAFAAILADSRGLANDLRGLSLQLAALGEDVRADAVADLAAKVQDLVNRLDDGAVTADEFRLEVSRLNAEAATTVREISAIDGVSLDRIIGRIGGIASAIKTAISLARSLRAALSESAPEATGPVWEPVEMPGRGGRPAPKAPSELGFEPVKTGGGKGKSRQDDFARTVEQIRDQTRALEAEAAALIAVAESGKDYGDAVEYARKRAELLNAAQKAGKAITPSLTAEIDKLAEAYVTAGQNAEDAAERLKRIEENGKRGAEAISDIFTSVLDGSRSAKQAVADLLMEMAKVQMQRAILGMAGSGNGFFSFVGGLLGGARAGGGPVQAGVPYLVNENTPRSEVFVPSTSGAVLNVQQAQAALRGGGGASGSSGTSAVDVRVYVDQDGNWQAAVERISAPVAMAAAQGMAKQMDRALPARLKQIQSSSLQARLR